MKPMSVSLSRRPALLGALAVAALAAGCASSVKLDETPVETRTPVVTDNAGTTAPAAQSSVATVDLSQQNAELLAAARKGRVVYFDFDSFVVKDEFRPALEANAKVLNGNKQAKMLIEGHTDERGGREYNLALGQKRAEAVQKTLVLLGVGEAQLEAVSYGEERPAAEGHDEAAWAKNRHAELKDR